MANFEAILAVDRKNPANAGRLGLKTRVGLVLTGLAAAFLLVLASVWLHSTRLAIHEEVEAASRVSEQWLSAVTAELRQVAPSSLPDRLLGIVQPLGRIRANALEVFAADGRLLYRSPPPTYKAGRVVPDWFAALLAVELAPRQLTVGALHLALTPDASRALIDAWDDLLAMAGWAVALLGLLFLATHLALARALRPLALVMQALEQTGHGRFETRLPVFATPELGRLSRAFNGMADRLIAAVDANVRLETGRELAEQMQSRLEAERRLIARDLHDELAQGITAVRALAGAITQRTADQPALQSYASHIVGVTGEMQDGVRGILHRLHAPAISSPIAQLERTLAAWQMQHPDMALSHHLELGEADFGDELAQALQRIIQEGLTNVARHARASRVEILISRQAGWLRLSIADNGCGAAAGQSSPQAGCGLGLAGMAERVARLGGHLRIDQQRADGFRLVASLPAQPVQHSLPEPI